MQGQAQRPGGRFSHADEGARHTGAREHDSFQEEHQRDAGRRYASLRPLLVVLGLALIGLVLAPSASGAPLQDTVTAAGMAGPNPSFGPGGYNYSSISIAASSGTSGQNASGTAAYVLGDIEGVSGPITCLNVIGPGRGGGTASSPTTAVFNVDDLLLPEGGHGIQTVELVDHGGNGNDTISGPSSSTPRAPGDCSTFTPSPADTFALVGRAVVFDAPDIPTNASFTTNPSSSTVGTQVTFDAASSFCAATPCTYAWTDGANSLGSGTPLAFTFHFVGVKHVQLTVTDALGGTSSVQHDLPVSASPPSPIVIIIGFPSSPTSPFGGSPTQQTATLKLLIPKGRFRISRILNRGAFEVTFTAPKSGQAVIRLYAGVKLVAIGRSRFAHAASHEIKLKLTPTGRRLLKHVKHIKLTIKGYFKPTIEPAITALGTFTLRR